MSIIQISSLTAAGLRDGEFANVLPEYYELKKVTENGAWHLNQNVFDHVVKVFSSFESLLHFDFLSANQREKITAYLDQRIHNHTHKDILTLTVLLHDIAKTETLIVYPDKTSNCPGHEFIGAAMMKNYKDRFNLSEAELIRLERMVQYHGFVSVMIDRIEQTHEVIHNQELFKHTVGDLALDLLLFIYADLHGCDLDKSKPELFQKYKDIQIECIQNNISLL